MPFQKPSSLSDRFHHRFDISNDGCIDDFFERDQTYAISSAENAIIDRFRLVFKDKRYISVPYSTLPVLFYMGDTLVIRAYGIKISIYGKGMHIIENHIHTQTLLYVQESSNGIDIGDQDVFINRIEVEGKNISPELSPEEEI